MGANATQSVFKKIRTQENMANQPHWLSDTAIKFAQERQLQQLYKNIYTFEDKQTQATRHFAASMA